MSDEFLKFTKTLYHNLLFYLSLIIIHHLNIIKIKLFIYPSIAIDIIVNQSLIYLITISYPSIILRRAIIILTIILNDYFVLVMVTIMILIDYLYIYPYY